MRLIVSRQHHRTHEQNLQGLSAVPCIAMLQGGLSG